MSVPRKFTPPSVTTGPGGKRVEIYGWNKTCKFCGKADLRWVGTESGGNKVWHLEERDSSVASGVKTHRCPAYTSSRASDDVTVSKPTVVAAEPTINPEPEPARENYGDW